MKQPAIILITCDELRKDAVGAYGTAPHTPHIDSIAEGGTRFDKCYTVSPWCLPARGCILTGKYPHRTGAYSNFRPSPLDKEKDNLFTRLKAGGYHTSLFGKCHFAPVPYADAKADKTLPYDEFRDYYARLGIDHLALQDDKQVSIWFYDDYSKELDEAGYLAAYRSRNWNKENRLLYPFPGPAKWHPDAWVGRKAAEYIAGWDTETPFFTWVSFSGPHYPFDAPKEYLERIGEEALPPRLEREGEWDDPGRVHYKSYHGGGNIDGARCAPEKGCKNYTEEHWDKLRRSYRANMALIDDQVGKILAAARERFGEDCLVLFTADHGEMLGDHGVWGKHNCGYEQVWSIPLLARFPTGNQPAATDAMVNLADILPTALEAAGCEAGDGDWDGVSLTKQLETGGYDYTFAEGEGYGAVTDGKYKYIHIQKAGEDYRELLDLRADPGEFENHYGDPAYQGIEARLTGKLLEHFFPAVLP